MVEVTGFPTPYYMECGLQQVELAKQQEAMQVKWSEESNPNSWGSPPGHTHTVVDPGHTHTVIDPAHAHQDMRCCQHGGMLSPNGDCPRCRELAQVVDRLMDYKAPVPWWNGEAWSPLNIKAWDVTEAAWTIATTAGDRRVSAGWMRETAGLEVDLKTGAMWNPCDCVACRDRLRVGTTSSDVWAPLSERHLAQLRARNRIREKQETPQRKLRPVPAQAMRFSV